MTGSFVSVGMKFPEFNLKAVVALEKGKEFKYIGNEDFQGKWAVMFWWPKDFTAVCPTELVEFNNHYADFTGRNALLIGASTDSEYVHHAWRMHDSDLKAVKFPMLSDISKSLAAELGILSSEEKVAYRATYILDPEGIVRWLCINDLSVGRNVDEVLRVLDALQTDELCPCNWVKGDDTLESAVG